MQIKAYINKAIFASKHEYLNADKQSTLCCNRDRNTNELIVVYIIPVNRLFLT